MSLYIAGFTGAGIFVGVVWPLVQRRVAMYLAFAFGGALVGIAIILTEARGGKSSDLSDWIIGVVIGAVMGCAFAYGFRNGAS